MELRLSSVLLTCLYVSKQRPQPTGDDSCHLIHAAEPAAAKRGSLGGGQRDRQLLKLPLQPHPLQPRVKTPDAHMHARVPKRCSPQASHNTVTLQAASAGTSVGTSCLASGVSASSGAPDSSRMRTCCILPSTSSMPRKTPNLTGCKHNSARCMSVPATKRTTCAHQHAAHVQACRFKLVRVRQVELDARHLADAASKLLWAAAG